MAEVPGLDRKINAWLYRHDRPGLQFSSRKSMHLPRSGLKTRSSARFVHVRLLIPPLLPTQEIYMSPV